jgi:hypothetical protein
MNHYYLTADGNRSELSRVKGVKILSKRPSGTFTRFWEMGAPDQTKGGEG